MAKYEDIIRIKNKNKKITERSELLEKAWECRNFEIDTDWKRTAYFVVFISAIFVGYNSDGLKEEPFIKFFLLGLGCIFSFIWYLVNRGSKHIYENWEEHIHHIEKMIGDSIIYSKIFFKNTKDLLSAKPFSPSKANILISFIIVISVYILFIREFCLLTRWNLIFVNNYITQSVKIFFYMPFFETIMFIAVPIIMFISYKKIQSGWYRDIKKYNINEDKLYLYSYKENKKDKKLYKENEDEFEEIN